MCSYSEHPDSKKTDFCVIFPGFHLIKKWKNNPKVRRNLARTQGGGGAFDPPPPKKIIFF